MIWRIYKYTNVITKQSYIGQTSTNVNVRAGKNGQCYCKGTLFREAIDKYGFDNFEQSILRLCTSQEEADEYERYFIDKYNTTYPNGYNLASGGRKGNTTHNLTKQKQSESYKGKPAWNKGQHISDETKEKISKSKKGKPSNIKGHFWFNNGIKNIRAFECPEGYVLGMLHRS